MRFLVLLVIMVSVGACATSDEARNADGEEESPAPSTGLRLASDHPAVKTVQVHGTRGQTTLPVVVLGDRDAVRVAFDILESHEGASALGPRPVSVYFHHADREWRRDLSPGEYMDSFHHDTILDYRPSVGTQIPYSHYEYRFPNDAIDFTVSGNYIVRVTEQGRENNVLFERPFFVSEQTTPLDMRLDDVLLIGSAFRGIQPFVQFRPTDAGVSPFDYEVCFVRNAEVALPRCAGGPSLAANPDLSFYLEPEDAFIPRGAGFFVGLGDIRAGGHIERTSQSTRPWRVWLVPDQARFPGTGLAPFLNGQAVINGALRAEYIDTMFRFVPLSGQPIAGGAAVSGTFNGWQPDSLMTWNEVESWYEQQILVKQGQHEYRYVVSDPSNRHALDTGLAQFENQFTSFVYLDDIRVQTDRLIAVVGAVLR